MGLFREIIFESLLAEGQVGVPQIESSLDNHHVIKINYNSPDTDKIASGERNIYPVAYGLSLKGNPVIRAYQPEGDTASKVPSWKLFRLDRIENWEDTDEVYTTRDIPDLRHSMDVNRYDSKPISKQEIENPDLLSKTAKEEPIQNRTIGNTGETIDNADKNSHIPIGISPETAAAPDNKPVTQNNPVFNNQGSENNDNEEETTSTLPSEPIVQDSEEDTEENDEGMEDELNKINSLTERINRLRR